MKKLIYQLKEVRLSKYGRLQRNMRKTAGIPKASKPKFKVGDVVVVDGLKTPGKIWRVNSYDDHLGDRTYSIRFVKGEHTSSQTYNEKSLRRATKAEKATVEGLTEAQRRYPASLYGKPAGAAQRGKAAHDPNEGAGNFYYMKTSSSEFFFYRTGTLKNGNASGYQVDIAGYTGFKPSKPKKKSQSGVDSSPWKRIDKSDIPDNVMAKFRAVMEGVDLEIWEASYPLPKGLSRTERFTRILQKIDFFGGGWVSVEHAKKTWGVSKVELDHLVKTGHLRIVQSGDQAGQYELTDKGMKMLNRAKRKESVESVDEDQMGRAIFVGAPKVSSRAVGRILNYKLAADMRKGDKISYIHSDTLERWELVVTEVASEPDAYEGPTITVHTIGKVVARSPRSYGINREERYALIITRGRPPVLYRVPAPGAAGRWVRAQVQKGSLRLENADFDSALGLEEGKYHEVNAFSMRSQRGPHGSTETVFWIEDPENPGNHEYIGKGRSPVARRTDAMEQHAAKFGIIKPLKHVNFRERGRRQAIKGVTQAGGSGNKAKSTTIKIATMTGVDEIQAIVMGEYAYYKAPGSSYAVAHVPSGFALTRNLSKHDASALMRRLHKQLPHPLPGAQFGKHPTDKGQLERLKKIIFASEGVFTDELRDQLLAQAL